MRVPGIIYASDKLMKAMGKDESPKQVANVAQLPGIVTHSLAMPDMHWGYGFPIGGVAAFDINGGIVSPGGVGYDINCGCRLMMTNLRQEEIRPHIAKIVNALFHHVPSGVGSKGALKLSRSEEKRVLVEGARWAVKNGYGSQDDLESMEDGGCLPGADPEAVSEGHSKGERTRWAPWAPATISSRWRSSRRFSTGTWPRPWESKSARWPS